MPELLPHPVPNGPAPTAGGPGGTYAPGVPAPASRASATGAPGAFGAEPAPASINFRELASVLRRRGGIIVAVTALVAAVSVYFAHGNKPQYIARASVRLTNPRRAMTSNIASDDPQGASDNNADRRVSKIQVLTSRTLVGAAVDREPARFRLRLEGAPLAVLKDVTLAPEAPADSVVLLFGHDLVSARADQGSATAPYGRPLDVAGARFTVASEPRPHRVTLYVSGRDEAVDRVLGGLRAKQREQADVIDISYTDADPRFAQQAVNSIVSTFADGDVEDAQRTSRKRRIFIDQQLQHNDSLLAVAQGALTALRAREGAFSARDRFAAEQTGMTALQSQREALAAERASYESLLSGLRSRAGSAAARGRMLPPVPAMANNAVIASLYNELAKYQTRRDSLTGPWGHAATHPDVQAVDQLIAASEANLTEAAQTQLASLDARIARVDQLAARNSSEMNALPALEAEELRLANAVESYRKLGEQLRDESQRLRISEAVQVGQVEILDLATLPAAPLGNGRMPRVVVGMVVGLALGCGAAFLRERLDTTISRRAELQDVLNLPALALVPRNSASARQVSLRDRLLGSLDKRRDADDELRALSPIDRAAAEAYVTLRTNLLYSRAGGAPRTIVVTSSAPGDGKTTVASNLARAYAQQGARVLLVDCDLRRSRLHRLFAVAAQPGLCEVLQGRAIEAEAVVETSVSGIWLLPAGGAPEHPSELLGGAEMRELVEHAREAFDVVIMDTPPALAVADAAILGARSDGVVFVVRAGATERDAARTALDQLQSVGARIAGAVLNDPDDRVATYPGYYYYPEYYTRTAAA